MAPKLGFGLGAVSFLFDTLPQLLQSGGRDSAMWRDKLIGSAYAATSGNQTWATSDGV